MLFRIANASSGKRKILKLAMHHPLRIGDLPARRWLRIILGFRPFVMIEQKNNKKLIEGGQEKWKQSMKICLSQLR
jgi:hypothetical protein